MRTRILQLIAQKQATEGKRVTAVMIADETQLSRQTIYKWINGDLSRFDEKTVVALCKYFNCTMNDLLYVDLDAP